MIIKEKLCELCEPRALPAGGWTWWCPFGHGTPAKPVRVPLVPPHSAPPTAPTFDYGPDREEDEEELAEVVEGPATSTGSMAATSLAAAEYLKEFNDFYADEGNMYTVEEGSTADTIEARAEESCAAATVESKVEEGEAAAAIGEGKVVEGEATVLEDLGEVKETVQSSYPGGCPRASQVSLVPIGIYGPSLTPSMGRTVVPSAVTGGDQGLLAVSKDEVLQDEGRKIKDLQDAAVFNDRREAAVLEGLQRAPMFEDRQRAAVFEELRDKELPAEPKDYQVPELETDRLETYALEADMLEAVVLQNEELRDKELEWAPPSPTIGVSPGASTTTQAAGPTSSPATPGVSWGEPGDDRSMTIASTFANSPGRRKEPGELEDLQRAAVFEELRDKELLPGPEDLQVPELETDMLGADVPEADVLEAAATAFSEDGTIMEGKEEEYGEAALGPLHRQLAEAHLHALAQAAAHATPALAVPKGPQELLDVPKGPQKLVDVPKGPQKLVDVPKGPQELLNVPKGPQELLAVPKSPQESLDVPEGPQELLDMPKVVQELLAVSRGGQETPAIVVSPPEASTTTPATSPTSSPATPGVSWGGPGDDRSLTTASSLANPPGRRKGPGELKDLQRAAVFEGPQDKELQDKELLAAPKDPQEPKLETDRPGADVLEADVLEADVLEADVLKINVLEADALEADVLEADVLEADVLEADVLEADVLEADVLEANVLEANVLEADVPKESGEAATIMEGKVEEYGEAALRPPHQQLAEAYLHALAQAAERTAPALAVPKGPQELPDAPKGPQELLDVPEAAQELSNMPKGIQEPLDVPITLLQPYQAAPTDCLPPPTAHLASEEPAGETLQQSSHPGGCPRVSQVSLVPAGISSPFLTPSLGRNLELAEDPLSAKMSPAPTSPSQPCPATTRTYLLCPATTRPTQPSQPRPDSHGPAQPPAASECPPAPALSPSHPLAPTAPSIEAANVCEAPIAGGTAGSRGMVARLLAEAEDAVLASIHARGAILAMNQDIGSLTSLPARLNHEFDELENKEPELDELETKGLEDVKDLVVAVVFGDRMEAAVFKELVEAAALKNLVEGAVFEKLEASTTTTAASPTSSPATPGVSWGEPGDDRSPMITSSLANPPGRRMELLVPEGAQEVDAVPKGGEKAAASAPTEAAPTAEGKVEESGKAATIEADALKDLVKAAVFKDLVVAAVFKDLVMAAVFKDLMGVAVFKELVKADVPRVLVGSDMFEDLVEADVLKDLVEAAPFIVFGSGPALRPNTGHVAFPRTHLSRVTPPLPRSDHDTAPSDLRVGHLLAMLPSLPAGAG